MPKRAVFERSRRELSLDVSVGVHILLEVVEQSSLESQSIGVCQDFDTYGNGYCFLRYHHGPIFYAPLFSHTHYSIILLLVCSVCV